jgi:hypothetical protein
LPSLCWAEDIFRLDAKLPDEPQMAGSAVRVTLQLKNVSSTDVTVLKLPSMEDCSASDGMTLLDVEAKILFRNRKST